MSVTPPPTYSPPKQEATALTGVVSDLKQALSQVAKTTTVPEVAQKHFNVENPAPVNVFVSNEEVGGSSRDHADLGMLTELYRCRVRRRRRI